jgi:transcriptional regulator with PAS, ATPase and Fis domain
MAVLSNELLLKAKTPLKELISRHILVLLNEKGDVLDLGGRPVSHNASVIRKLEAPGNIRPLFDMDADTSLSHIVRTNPMIMSRGDKFVFGEGVERFYSILPVVWMRIEKLEEDRFLGVVSVSDIVPNFFEQTSGCLFYMDTQDRIKGFNKSFFDLFSEKYRDPHQLFDKPAGDFFSPTPVEIQRNFLKTVQPPLAERFDTVYEKDFTLSDLGEKEELSRAQDFKGTAQGLLWQAPEDTESFFTILEKVDLRQQDIRVSVELAAQADPPCAIFGNRKHDYEYLDQYGYLLGPGVRGEHHMLKKAGFLQFLQAHPNAPDPRLSYDFIKADKAFFIYSGGQRLFYYYDYDFLVGKNTMISLFLRPGQQCVLKRVRIGTRSLAHFEDPAKVVVKVNTAGSPYFLLNRFDNFQLSMSHPDITGFRLQDVTELKQQVESLEQRYQEQIKQEKRLKDIIQRYKREYEQFVGSGKAVTLVKETAARVAGSKTTVLIQGATGTGKEVLAKYIHDTSDAARGPFIKVDCSTLPRTLMESELFGHEKGAFTGAVERKTGLFERAEGGTIFLDEVNNLTPETQVKLLQFLNDFTIVRVGGQKPLKLNVRLVAASGADLKAMVQRGFFREDLYFRIAVVLVSMPLLRERLEDLPELCQYFLDIFGKAKNKRIARIAPAAFKKMYAYAWPGNVRELKNVIERAVVFCDEKEIGETHIVFGAEDLASIAKEPPGRKPREPITLGRDEVLDLLEKHRWVVQKAAQELGVTKRALYYHFRKIGLSPNAMRKNPHRPRPS